MRTQTEKLVELPEALRKQFAVLERRLWRVDTIIAVAGAVCSLLLSYALLFISDRFWDTPVWLRMLFTGIGVAVLAWFVAGWLRLWVWKRRDARALANIVQKQYRRLGDRLLGIVELADENSRPANVSPALCHAAINQVAQEALRFDFRLAVATRKPRLYSLAAIILLLLTLAPVLIVPQAGANAFLRWLLPVASTPRYTFVELSKLPEQMVVPHGEPFEIAVGITNRTFYKPFAAYCQYERQPPIQTQIRTTASSPPPPELKGFEHWVLFQVPPQTEQGKLRLRIGDVSRLIHVKPTPRPELKTMLAQMQFPDYLHYPDIEREVKNGRFTALEGSRVVFTGKTSRRLLQASMGIERATPITVKDDTFATPPVTVAGDMKLGFSWKDELGLSVKSPILLAISAQKDQPPQVDMPELGRAIAVLEDEVIPIRITAADDYGLKNISMKLEIALPQQGDDVKVRTNTVKSGGWQEKKMEAKYEFSPLILHLPPGSHVGLRALAEDYLPGRPPAESALHRIFIMSKEEHARLIMDEFEKLRAAIEELTRKQENLAGDTKLVKEMKPEEMSREETGKQLNEQAQEQADYQRDLEKLAQEGLKTTREAMRNSSIPTDTIKEWTENVEIMQNIARQPMANAMRSLRQGAQNPQQRSEEVSQAHQQEQEALQNLQDLQKKMAATLDKMQSKSLADRLRAMGETEKGVAENLQKTLPETIGLSLEKLPPPVRKNINNLAANQEAASKQTRKLQDEIQRFYQRTQSEKHGEVHQQMEETKVVDLLAQVGDFLKENIGSQAMSQSQELAAKFFKWAEMLDGEKGGGGGGGGGGSGQQMSEEDLAKMLELLRIRESQENLREQTRLLDVFKKGRETYTADTSKLATKQHGLSRDLSKLKKDRLFNKARAWMEGANEAMDDAAAHLERPRTDEPTFNAQTDAMNLLDEALKSLMQSNQQGQGQGQQQGMMAFMQMMAMGQAKPQVGEQPGGQTPGGNTGGGPSDRPNQTYTGDMRGRTGPSRTTERVSGSGTRVLPAEYREALQNYFNAIEKAN